MKLGKYSFGIGDRFAQEAEAQLAALIQAKDGGIDITPVWNKSFREHGIIKSHPSETREKADLAVQKKGWKYPYFVDADHINLKTVDIFLDHADFFTLDVADYIDQPASAKDTAAFFTNTADLIGELTIPGITKPFFIDRDFLELVASRYLKASLEAKRIYACIAERKGEGNFITEVSMDEVATPQSPLEIFFILRLLKEIPLHTIAPKFTGQFYKGIDYVGDVAEFESNLEEIMLILNYAKKQFNLPDELKISIHSGSDKFSLYPAIQRLARKHNQGIHLKTAGTTWLEEVIGLALAGGDALDLVKTIYRRAWERRDELCKPYQSVINIDPDSLPDPHTVNKWNSEKFVGSLRHIPDHPDFNPHIRQLIHVGYKVAAEMRTRFVKAIKKNHILIAQQVTQNLYERHVIPLFSQDQSNNSKQTLP